jgi:hypothetical protein
LPMHGHGRVLGLRPEDITLDGDQPGHLHGRVTISIGSAKCPQRVNRH